MNQPTHLLIRKTNAGRRWATSCRTSRQTGRFAPPSFDIRFSNCCQAGFTLIELLVVIGIIGILAGLIMPSLGRSLRQAKRIQCSNNLRQIGIAFQQFADLNNNQYPMQLPGFRIPADLDKDRVNFLVLDARPFQEVAAELVLPRLLVCAADTGREPAESFGTLSEEHISYRVATNAAPGNAATVVATDRNVIGTSAEEAQLDMSGRMEFDRNLHDLRGNVLMGDGRLEWIGGFAWQSTPVAHPGPADDPVASLEGIPRPADSSPTAPATVRPTVQSNRLAIGQRSAVGIPAGSAKSPLVATNEVLEAPQPPPVAPVVVTLLSPDSVRAPSDGTSWWWWLLLLLIVLAWWILRNRGRRDPGIGRMEEFYTGAAINAEAMLATLEANEIPARWEYVHAKQREHEDENTRPMRIYVDKNEVEHANELFSADQ